MARRRFSVRMRKNVNVPRVVAKTTAVIIALYVGNEVINQIGSIINCTSGPFNTGFKLIGWTVSDNVFINDTAGGTCTSVGLNDLTTYNNLVTDVSGAGVLSVIGVVGVAAIVLEFVQFNM